MTLYHVGRLPVQQQQQQGLCLVEARSRVAMLPLLDWGEGEQRDEGMASPQTLFPAMTRMNSATLLPRPAPSTSFLQRASDRRSRPRSRSVLPHLTAAEEGPREEGGRRRHAGVYSRPLGSVQGVRMNTYARQRPKLRPIDEMLLLRLQRIGNISSGGRQWVSQQQQQRQRQSPLLALHRTLLLPRPARLGGRECRAVLPAIGRESRDSA